MAREFDIDKLLALAQDAIRDDIQHIASEVKLEKLSRGSASDLVSYLKLLAELKDRQKADGEEELSGMTDDELKSMARKLLDGSEKAKTKKGSK